MTVRKLPGTPTLGGPVFWKDIAEQDGWRIQYNKTLDKSSPLKPFRLLDPENVLWASADTIEEFQNELPQLIQEFADKEAIVTKEHVKAAAGVAGQLLLALVTKGKAKGK